MTFGAVFASILAVLTASAGAAHAAPSEVDAAAAPAIAPEQASTAAEGAAQADAPSYPPPQAEGADAAIAEAAPPNALAEAARVAIAAAEAGTPIIVAPAQDGAADAVSGADGETPPELVPAPAGPPLSNAAPILLDRVEEPDGWATERLIEPSGEIVLHTVNAAGTVQVCNPVGSLLSLAIVEQRPAAGGEYVHVARDTSGALVTYAVGTDGEPRAVRLLAPAPR